MTRTRSTTASGRCRLLRGSLTQPTILTEASDNTMSHAGPRGKAHVAIRDAHEPLLRAGQEEQADEAPEGVAHRGHDQPHDHHDGATAAAPTLVVHYGRSALGHTWTPSHRSGPTVALPDAERGLTAHPLRNAYAPAPERPGGALLGYPRLRMARRTRSLGFYGQTAAFPELRVRQSISFRARTRMPEVPGCARRRQGPRPFSPYRSAIVLPGPTRASKSAVKASTAASIAAFLTRPSITEEAAVTAPTP